MKTATNPAPASYDSFLALVESFAWAGVTVESAGKDMGWIVDVPCAYSHGRTHLCFWVTWAEEGCRDVQNLTTDERFPASWASCESALRSAVANIVAQMARDLPEIGGFA